MEVWLVAVFVFSLWLCVSLIIGFFLCFTIAFVGAEDSEERRAEVPLRVLGWPFILVAFPFVRVWKVMSNGPYRGSYRGGDRGPALRAQARENAKKVDISALSV